MARIGKLAEMYGCAFVIISHMNKDSQKSPIYRALGSIDIPAAARSVLAIAKNPKNDREKIFVHAKSSLARTGSALTFEINDDFGISITGQTDLDATDVLNPPVKRESPKLDFAKELIVRLLKEGTNNANDIIEEALKNGISEKTLKKARQELGVVVKKVGFNKNRVSWWELKDE
jgi:hypothetical protein